MLPSRLLPNEAQFGWLLEVFGPGILADSVAVSYRGRPWRYVPSSACFEGPSLQEQGGSHETLKLEPIERDSSRKEGER